MILLVIRKLLSIRQGLKLYEIRITKRMVEEKGIYELRVIPVEASTDGRNNKKRRELICDVILPCLDRQLTSLIHCALLILLC